MNKKAGSRIFSAALRAGCVVAAMAVSPLCAAQTYPSKPIKIVIPYTPGGSIDTVGRLVAEQLQKQMGQSIVIENHAGASGLIGSASVQRARADGYTLLFNASSQVYMPLVVSKPTYDAEKDFTPIAQVGYVPLVVAVNNDLPVKTLGDLARLSKAAPGKYTWATSGLGTTSHLSEEIINRALKLDMEIITYKGAVPQLTDVVGGHVSAAISPMPGVHPFVSGGRLKAIAVTSKSRVEKMPDVPTVAESGVPDFELLSWYGLWGPAGLPDEIAERLNQEVRQAVRTASLKARFDDLSFVPTQLSREAFRQVIGKDIEVIGKSVKEANIRISF